MNHDMISDGRVEVLKSKYHQFIIGRWHTIGYRMTVLCTNILNQQSWWAKERPISPLFIFLTILIKDE